MFAKNTNSGREKNLNVRRFFMTSRLYFAAGPKGKFASLRPSDREPVVKHFFVGQKIPLNPESHDSTGYWQL
jgi:hypothetical protein